MTEISERYRGLATEFTRRVEAVPPDQWDSPSPCAEWSARDVLRHVIDVHAHIPTYVGLSLDLDGSVDEHPAGAWAQARDRMQELLDDPQRADLEHEGYLGRARLADTVDKFQGIDLLVHGWDIARATGQDETLPAHEVHRVHQDALSLGDGLRTEGLRARSGRCRRRTGTRPTARPARTYPVTGR